MMLRRRFLGRVSTLCVLPAVPLLAFPSSTDAAKLSTPSLLTELDELSQQLHAGQIDGGAWQAHAEALFARADVSELLAAITLDWKPIHRETRRTGQIVHQLDPDQLRGCPPDPAFRRKLFSFSSNHAVIPHAHHNLVSAFLVLAGRFRGRHFDRIREDTDAVIIRPTDDRTFQLGDAAAISDIRNNVHWFTALEDEALLFNVSVTIPEHLRGSSASSTGRIYLDPDGEALEGGLIRAPRASVSQLRAKYDG
jgi:hypothetical protein